MNRLKISNGAEVEPKPTSFRKKVEKGLSTVAFYTCGVLLAWSAVTVTEKFIFTDNSQDGDIDKSIESITLHPWANIRENHAVNNKNDPSNIIESVQEETNITISPEDETRVYNDPGNGEWYSFKLDGKVVWVNGQRADANRDQVEKPLASN